MSPLPTEPDTCSIFLSEQAPMPLRGRLRILGSAAVIARMIRVAETEELILFTVLTNGGQTPVYVNPRHIIAVL